MEPQNTQNTQTEAAPYRTVREGRDCILRALRDLRFHRLVYRMANLLTRPAHQIRLTFDETAGRRHPRGSQPASDCYS